MTDPLEKLVLQTQIELRNAMEGVSGWIRAYDTPLTKALNDASAAHARALVAYVKSRRLDSP